MREGEVVVHQHLQPRHHNAAPKATDASDDEGRRLGYHPRCVQCIPSDHLLRYTYREVQSHHWHSLLLVVLHLSVSLCVSVAYLPTYLSPDPVHVEAHQVVALVRVGLHEHLGTTAPQERTHRQEHDIKGQG